MNAKKAKKIRRQFRDVAQTHGITRNDVVQVPYEYGEIQYDSKGNIKLDAKGQPIVVKRYKHTVENRGYRRAYQEAKKAVKEAEGTGEIPRGGEVDTGEIV